MNELAELEFRERYGGFKERIPYENVDSGIRDLVKELNQLSFLVTHGSCSGHLRDWARINISDLIYPDEECSFLTAGKLIFGLDLESEEALTFKQEVKELAEKYPFVELTPYLWGYKKRYSKPDWIIDLNNDDLLVGTPEIVFENDKEKQYKESHQVNSESGEERIKGFSNFWTEFWRIVGKYSPLETDEERKVELKKERPPERMVL